MKKNKLLCLLLCVVMVASLVMPGTWAMETQATETTTETQTVETTTATTEPTATKETSEPTETPTESTTAPTEAKETEPSDPTEETKKVEETEATEPTQETTEATVPETTEETEKTCTCGAAEGAAHAANCPLFVFDVEAAYQYIMAMESEEELVAYLQTLNEEQANALSERMTEADVKKLAERFGYHFEEEIYTPAKNYTSVGKLMPPVPVYTGFGRRPLKARSNSEPENGLILDKTVVATGNPGEYKITMEAFTTGNVTSSTKAVPTDIVLVLDESGSMAENMYKYTKVYSLDKNGTYYVKRGDSFVTVKYCDEYVWLVHDRGWYTGFHGLALHWGTKYDPMTSAGDTNSSHVQFYTRSETATSKNEALEAAVGTFIDNVYKDAGANNVDHRVAIIGFSDNANTKIGLVDDIRNNRDDVYNAGTNLNTNGGTQIEKGAAAAKNVFDNAVPTTATTRNRVVIYFTDGIPGNGKWSDTTISNSANPAIATSYDLKKNYGATVYSIGMLDDADPEMEISDETDNAARTNKFLHYLSSNYPDAISMNNGGSGSNAGYYLSASDTASLNAIFKKIQENISTPSISLDSSTVIRDSVTKYFNVPANTTDVTVTSYPCKSYNSTTGDVVWSENGTVINNAVTITDNAVDVTGFDFNKNFVSENPKPDGSHGAKVVIEFTVKRKAEFVGGNDVPTNEWDKSGVYKDNKEVELFHDENTTPTVNVPITEPTVTPHDKTIYEGKATAVSGLYDQPEADGWQYDYVHVEPGIAGVTGDTVSPDDCTTYSVTITYKPKTDGKKSGKDGGTANAMTGVFDTKTATVHVLKPTVNVTVNDVEAAYGEDYTLGDKADAKVTSVNWTDKTDGHTNIPVVEAGTTEPYTKDDLTFAYECVDKTITVTDGKITVPDKDVDVTVTVKHGDTVLTDAIITTTCTIQDSGCTTPDTDKIYTVHVTSCKLTIKKAGKAYDASDSFIFDIFDKDNNKVATVTLHMDKEITISGLKKGTYTVSERTTGTRYNDQKAQEVNLTPKGYTVTFTNSVKTDTWLTNSDSEHNVFNGMPTDKG